MGELLDKATALGVKLAGGEAPKEEPEAPRYAAGQPLSDPDTGLVAVTNADGSTDFVKPEDTDAAIAHGSRPATEGEYYAAKGGTVGKIASAAVGAGQGASFDMLVPAVVATAKAIGGEEEGRSWAQAARAAQMAHPGTYLGGELAGSLAGAYALPGGGSSKVAQEEGALARAFSRAVDIAPRAMAEGAAFGVGHQLTEDAIGDHAATAQKLFASAEGGAVFGALLGGVMHAGTGAIGDVARGLLAKGARTAETEAYRAAGEARTEESGGAMKWLADKMKSTAEEQAFKATGAKTGAIEKLGATGPEQAAEARRLGRVVLDEVGVSPLSSKQDIATAVEDRTERAWKDLHELRAPLDKASARPDLHNILIEADKDIVQPLTGRTLAELQAGMAPNAGGLYGDLEAAPVLDAIGRLEARGGETPTFETLYNLRRDLDTHLQKAYARGPGPRPPGEQALMQFRGIIENEYMRAGEEAAKELGTDFAAKYQLTKSLYSDLKTLSTILRKEVPRETANRSISLTDTIAGAGGLSTAAAALMSGHPLGMLAAGAPLVNKAIRTYGNQAAAFVLNKASQLEAIRRVSAKFDERAAEGVAGFIKGGAKGTSVPLTPPKATAETAQRIREAASNPAALRAHVEDLIAGSGLRDNAPSIAQALATTTMRAATYLAAKAPVDPPRQSLAFKPLPPRPIGATDMQRFQNIIDTVNDPQSVIEDLKQGRLDRDKIEALKNVYPQLYAKLQSEMSAQLTERKPDLSPQQERTLGVLFGTPINAMFRPNIINGFQQAFDQGVDPSQTGQSVGQSASKRPLVKPPGLATGLDKIEASGVGS